MPTVASSTELITPDRPWPVKARHAAVDVTHLVRFRTSGLRRRTTGPALGLGFLVLTALAAVVPAFTEGAASSARASDVRLLLPTAMAGFLIIAVVAAVASGGGRELIPRDEAVAFPVSPTTDHLGALLLAPLNIAWLIQAWFLLGATAYALVPALLLPAQIGMLLWLAIATALAQVVAWAMEALRRRPHGVGAVRALGVLGVLAGLVLQLSGRLTDVLDRIPTVLLIGGLTEGWSWRWAGTVLAELLVLAAAVALGAVPAHLAARRTPRDEVRAESGHRPPRPMPRSVLAALVRTDRASVWRAVPMRRGLAVLAVAPGLVAIAGDLPWSTMTILPGLVASGGALLFGVNAWCLDGRGALWRASLPVAPSSVFAARAWVLAEFLMVAAAVTLALASLRAGLPNRVELAALLSTWVVVTLQVVAASLRWSARNPYPVDLRSARATPAPPVKMVGYSARLAVSTTLTGLVFGALTRAQDWQAPVLVAFVFLCWSAFRLARTRARWLDPVDRARVVTAVSA
ncbi:hypothetical protein [Nocardioides sp.]|uniref:hypothetical protein n=1 Tax=Nocardioides sp. TaxID=35761 RepID=UPI00356B00B8